MVLVCCAHSFNDFSAFTSSTWFRLCWRLLVRGSLHLVVAAIAVCRCLCPSLWSQVGICVSRFRRRQLPGLLPFLSLWLSLHQLRCDRGLCMLERSSSQAFFQSTLNCFHVALTFLCITPLLFLSKVPRVLLCNQLIAQRSVITITERALRQNSCWKLHLIRQEKGLPRFNPVASWQASAAFGGLNRETPSKDD